MVHEFLHQWIGVWLGWVERGGYSGVIVLMAMESSIFPVPSEIVVPPAAIVAAGGGRMTVPGVVLAATFGSWLGAALTYLVARWIGRAVINRFGTYFFLSREKIERAERFLIRYESGGIFFARLLPVVRHLISIPAGIIRMDFLNFSILTIAGSAIWCGVLAWLGGNIGRNNPELMQIADPSTKAEALMVAIKLEAQPIIFAIAIVCLLYFVARKLTAPRASV